MAKFIEGSTLNVVIEDLIRNADDCLYLISPYIKLHSRIKDVLKLKLKSPSLFITIMFGKNEDKSMSINEADLKFLKEYPNIEIRYEKNLHAKYYANEEGGLITSMNLYDFSQNNNIEVGVYTETPKTRIHGLVQDLVNNDNNLDRDAYNFFMEKVDNSELLFKREPHFESSMFGLNKKFINSTTEIDILDSFFNGKKDNSFAGYKNYEVKSVKAFKPKVKEDSGYCIRTGEVIPFNPERPFCAEAFKSWNQFKNKDYKEKFCHKTGKTSNGKTSFNNPIL